MSISEDSKRPCIEKGAIQLCEALEQGQNLTPKTRERLIQALQGPLPTPQESTEHALQIGVTEIFKAYLQRCKDGTREGRNIDVDTSSIESAQETIWLIKQMVASSSLWELLNALNFLNEFDHNIAGGVNAFYESHTREAKKDLVKLRVTLIKKLDQEELNYKNFFSFYGIFRKLFHLTISEQNSLNQFSDEITFAYQHAGKTNDKIEHCFKGNLEKEFNDHQAFFKEKIRIFLNSEES